MKIGFSTIYSWRPHVEQAYFLSSLAEKAGCKTYFLKCNSNLNNCYNFELKKTLKGFECLKCMLGNISTYKTSNVASIGDFKSKPEIVVEFNKAWVQSSASTIGRFESNKDYQSTEFCQIAERLAGPASVVYSAARQWIKNNNLDAVFVFNGRIDHTRAIFEAALAERIKVFSMERPWFSRGIQIYPYENCLGLKSVHKMVREWSKKPLSRIQALIGASYVARRFLKKNTDEWRSYNKQSINSTWPGKGGGLKVLIIPSSRNEIYGQSDYEPEWLEPIEGYDAVLSALNVPSQQVVLRCHPNWAEPIGKNTGKRSEVYYTDWAVRRGFCCIKSNNRADTLNLIRQADIIIVAHGSAALEAGVLGKIIISTAPAIYSTADFVINAQDTLSIKSLNESIKKMKENLILDGATIARKALRFVYTMTHRLPRYVDAVIPTSLTEMKYKQDCDPKQLMHLLKTCELEPNDKFFAFNKQAEDEVLAEVLLEKWEKILLETKKIDFSRGEKKMKKRWPYKIFSNIRKIIPRGDK